MNTNGTYGDPHLMYKLATYRMPYGKHAESLLIDLPISYLDWFANKGFPVGELGELMRIVHETKLGDMAHFLDNLRTNHPGYGTDYFDKK